MSSSIYKDNVYKMQYDRFKAFKSQDHEKGQFDVKFVIQGKTLFANKVFLTTVSEPMAAMLSDRWSAKDEPVNIQTYSFNCFYQFLCFIYIGGCKFTNDNIREMVDLAEFYGVPCLKDFCDGFLSRKQDFSPENIEEWYEFAQQYSLPAFTASIKNYIHEKGDVVIRENNFSSFKKPFVQFFSGALNGNIKEECFEAAYKWVEHHVMETTLALHDDNIDLEEKIKAELYTIIPQPEFARMKFEFLMNFVLERGFFVSPSKYFFSQFGSFMGTRFKWAYELAEKQALKKQSIAAKNGENFDVAASIQADLAQVIPRVMFHEMDKQFLMDFVVEKGFYLSADELKKIFDSFLMNKEQKFQSVYELAEKQALKKQMIAVKNGESFNISDIINADLAEVIPRAEFYLMDKQFLMDFVVEKGFILSATELFKAFKHKNAQHGQHFKYIYQIAEKQAVQKQKMSLDPDNFNLADSIKVDLAEVMPHVRFPWMKKEILLDFVLEKGLFLSPANFSNFFECQYGMSEQEKMESVYELAVKQASKKQMMASDGDNFNLIDCIKADLAEVIPIVKFYEMDKQFLMDFVVANGFISEAKANRVHETRVQIEDENKQIITGVFNHYRGFRRDKGVAIRRAKTPELRFCQIKTRLPSTPSTVTKMKGVKWYLCLEKSGIPTIKYYNVIKRSDYLLAQMENNDEFQLEGRIKISFSDNF